jgi:hypothetical protein
MLLYKDTTLAKYFLFLLLMQVPSLMNGQKLGDYCCTYFSSSPDNKYVIVSDLVYGEVGCYSLHSKLYKSPLNLTEFITIDALVSNVFSSSFYWHYLSKYFASQEGMGGRGDNFQCFKSCIKIFNIRGEIDTIINYASSPSFMGDDVYYYCERDESQVPTNPKIFRYNLITRKSKLVFEFDSKYTFWQPLYDESDYPQPLSQSNSEPHGLMGILYKRWQSEECYTFSIYDCAPKAKLTFWLKGDYIRKHVLPTEGILSK